MLQLGKNKTSRVGQITTGPGHSYVDLCVHPLDIQYPTYSIPLRGVLYRGAVVPFLKYLV